MTLAQKYQQSKDRCASLRLKTSHPDGDSYDGVVVGNMRRFIVLRAEYGFEFDGLLVFPKKVIKGYRDGKFERCCTQILRNNGQMNRLEPPSWLTQSTSIFHVLRELMHRDIWPAIEVVINDGKESVFYLGPIVYVNEDEVILHGYSADGEWEKSYEISHDEIFRIEFDSKYCNHFNEFIKTKKDTLEIVQTLKHFFEDRE